MIRVFDETGRLHDGKQADYFTFRALPDGSFETCDKRKTADD